MQGYSPAADNNKSAILSVLSHYLSAGDHVFEIGSGSGQHGIHMSASMPEIQWQPSDRAINLPTLSSNILEYGPPNLRPPIELDLDKPSRALPSAVQCVYAANVMHIVREALGAELISWAAERLDDRGYLILYGPYRYAGEFTTESNKNFDEWLKKRDSESGIRDFEWVIKLAAERALTLVKDHAMPANNQCLVFQKTAGKGE